MQVFFQLQYMVLSYLGIFFIVSMQYVHICGVSLLLYVSYFGILLSTLYLRIRSLLSFP